MPTWHVQRGRASQERRSVKRQFIMEGTGSSPLSRLAVSSITLSSASKIWLVEAITLTWKGLVEVAATETGQIAIQRCAMDYTVGWRLPDNMATTLMTDSVASTQRAASWYSAVLLCCNSTAKSMDARACFRTTSLLLPPSSIAI